MKGNGAKLQRTTTYYERLLMQMAYMISMDLLQNGLFFTDVKIGRFHVGYQLCYTYLC